MSQAAVLEARPVRNVALLAAIVLVIGLAAHFAFSPERAGQASMLYAMGLPYLVLTALAIGYAYRDGILKDWFSMRFGDFTRGIAGTALLFGAAYLFARIVTPPGSPGETWMMRVYLQLGEPALLRKHVGFVVVAIAFFALSEEIVWRGLVTSLLAEKVGSRRAWVWAAALYALAHVPTMWALRVPNGTLNPLVVLAALGCGLVWGGIVRMFGRLFPAFVAHAFFDWTVLMMFRLWGQSV